MTEEIKNANAATIIVGPKQTYTTIQSAINAANSGDIIKVYDGQYNESLTISKPLSILGNGSSKTILYASNNGYGIKITANNCLIRGFSITTDNSKNKGISISISSNNNTIEDINSNNNFQIGVDIGSSYNKILNSTFKYKYEVNTTNSYVRGIYSGSGTKNHNKILNSTFEQYYFGIQFWSSGYQNVSECTFNNCITGIHISNSPNNIIKKNKFINCGLLNMNENLNDATTQIVDGNLVNNLPLFYICNITNQLIKNIYGQILLINCSSIIIINQSIRNSTLAILTSFCENISVNNCTLNYNRFEGIQFRNSKNIILNNSTLVENGHGCGIGRSNNIKINSCLIKDSKDYSSITIGTSSLIKIENSFIKRKIKYGEGVTATWVQTNKNYFQNNSISGHQIGFSCDYSSTFNLINNTIQDNDR
jgi:nitrous oxidase accessory protein